MSAFPKTVKAANEVSKDKKALAEAIWLEIPPGQRGGKVPPGPTIPQRIESMSNVLTELGHEYSPKTLTDYREVAVWVHSPRAGGMHTWGDVSWHAHREAFQGGMKFPIFIQAVESGKIKGVDDVRRILGKSPTRRNDPAEIRGDIRDRILNDPETAEVAMGALRDRMDLTFDEPPTLPRELQTATSSTQRMVLASHAMTRALNVFGRELDEYEFGDDAMADAAINEVLDGLEALQANIRKAMGVML